MNTLIFRTMAPLIVAIMMIFAIYICLRGHNEPGGGFIGGLIAAAAMAIYGMSAGPLAVRQALRFDPFAIAGLGVVISAGAGLLSAGIGKPFLTGLWTALPVGNSELPLSTPGFFDIGVFLVVFGVITGIVLGLEDSEEEP